MARETYTEDSIRTLEWREHIRLRPGMYIGRLGDGSHAEDGIYVLLKEVIDNAVDEFVMGHGSTIEIAREDSTFRVRDYGRGIPLGKLEDCAARINTGAKYDSKAFKKSVGLNGIGIKAVNALSDRFYLQSFRDGKTRDLEYTRAEWVRGSSRARSSAEPAGTELTFHPDPEVFGEFAFRDEHIERMLRHYAYLNAGLTLAYNGKEFHSRNGLLDLLEEHLPEAPLYPVIHLRGEDVEIAITHTSQPGEECFSFVNGQHTTQGGTHLNAFREAFVKTVRDFFKRKLDPVDIRSGLCAAISLRIEEPVFESQTKTRLGSTVMSPNGTTVRSFLGAFLSRDLEIHLHQHPTSAEALLMRIQEAENERKELKDIQKLARDRARKAKIHNRKLRDCRLHYDTRHRLREHTTLFITEGNSASGTITEARDVDTQAVFSLKGKPLNCYGLNKKIVYENEEFNLLQHALQIEESLDALRYNRVVLATDADVDGMHIRLLLVTFFLQFFPDLIRREHLFILETPLFRVRNKKTTRYCYSDAEKAAALRECGAGAEITRFKGLGEISPHEMRQFIGKEMRLEQVRVDQGASIRELLEFYMGKNTPERQQFIIENLRVETDLVAEDA